MVGDDGGIAYFVALLLLDDLPAASEYRLDEAGEPASP